MNPELEPFPSSRRTNRNKESEAVLSTKLLAENKKKSKKIDPRKNKILAEKKKNLKNQKNKKQTEKKIIQKDSVVNNQGNTEDKLEEGEDYETIRQQKMKESRDTGRKLIFASFCVSICAIFLAVLLTGSIHYYYLTSSITILDLLGNLGDSSHVVKL